MSEVRRDDIHGDNVDNIKKKDYKLIVDPQIRRGEERLLRYEGLSYNTDNHGQGIVVLRDPRPRMNRLWSRRERAELPVPRYKVDEWYIGAVPPREVTFSRLNDNITKQFMEKMCIKFGKLERVRVYHHPKTQKHMGLSKVVFSSIKSASDCVNKLHMTSIMGNVIHAQIDCKGELLNKLFHRIIKGEMLAETIPDVIRHTQDGITMSNKYKEHHHHHSGKKERRKSSQDDPRKLRRSLDSKNKANAHSTTQHRKSSHDKEARNARRESEEYQGPDFNAAAEPTTPTPTETNFESEYNQNMAAESSEHETEGHLSDSEDSKSEKQKVWSSDLESRISSLLHEQTQKYKLDDAPVSNDMSSSRIEYSDSKDDEISDKKESGIKKKSHRRNKHHSTDSGTSNNLDSPQNERKSHRRLSEQSSKGISEDKLPKRHRSRNGPNSHSPPPPTFKHSPRRDFESPRENEQIRNLNVPHSRHDVEFIHNDRTDSRSRSPRRHPVCYEPPGRQFYEAPHERDRLPPPYHNKHPLSPRHSPGYNRDRRIKQEYPPERDRFDRGPDRFPMFRGDERNYHRPNPDFPYRRREMTPPRSMPSPRRHRPPHSPNRWIPPDRYQNEIRHRRHSPPRGDYYGHSSSRERSPRNWRRTPSPERRYKHRFDHSNENRSSQENRDRQRIRTPSPKPRSRNQSAEYLEKPSVSDVRKESSEKESPKLTLEERLQEMTGEVSSADVVKEINLADEQDLEEISSDGASSVDMEISEGESESEKIRKAEEIIKNQQSEPPPSGFVPNQNIPWNGFGPRVNVPMHMDSAMWNPMQPEFFKGFQRDPRFPLQFQSPAQFSQTRWPDPFHPSVRGMPPSSFHAGLNVPPSHHHSFQESSEEMQKRFEDHQLSQKVLDNVVQDLKNIVSRDLNRKVIETMAFKVYEAWWDENDDKKKIAATKAAPISVLTDRNTSIENTDDISEIQSDIKTDQNTSKENRSLLNTFDPLNWAKNSFEMDGFRIGLGLRSAISKMPSFRVKKRPRTPTPPRENNENDEIATKSRKLQDKENQGQSRKKSKDKKYSRITTLGSEGEDEVTEQSEDDSASENDEEEKYTVLDVDDIFSESSDSSDESDSENEKEESSDSETEVQSDAEKSEQLDRKATVLRTDEETNQSQVVNMDGTSEHEDSEATTAIDKPLPHAVDKIRLSGEEPHIAASLLSPTAQGITSASAITPQQLRHVHPKKRHRLLSKDTYESFTKVSDMLKSEDDQSAVNNKERTLSDTLADIPKTPGRLPSTNSDLSSPILPLITDSKSPTKPKTYNMITNDTSDIEPQPMSPMLDAASTLLSMRKTIPPISPQKDSTVLATSPGLSQSRKKKLILLANEDRARTAELAEEHNYFVPSYGPPLPHPSMDPVIAQILEEHCYSRPVAEQFPPATEQEKGISSPRSISTLSAGSVFNFEDDYSEKDFISAAERVKLRHVKPERKKRISKKERRQGRTLEVKFSPRSQVEELVILYEMWYNGLDLEDMKHIRTVYESYLEKSNSPAWVNESHWVPHPVTNIPTTSSKHRNKKRRNRSDKSSPEEEVEWHKTGSARTEGYYKMADLVKLRQRREMYGKGDSLSTVKKVVGQSCSGQGKELTSGAQGALDKNLGSRETRHFMRRIASEVGSDVGDLFKYNQLMFRKKAVKFKRSSIHGWGLFAEEPIGADEMVIEYVGQVVRTLIAERREVHYTEIGIGSSYLFRIDSEHIIDATKCGNYARFMNHSCNPSCYAKVITVDTAKKIVIYSKGPIKKSQEITYDYKFPLEDDKIMCYCGAENCRRTLN